MKMPVCGTVSDARDYVTYLRNVIATYDMILVPFWLSGRDQDPDIFFGDLTATFDLFIRLSAKSYEFQREVRNVRNLTCINPNHSISNFINLRELDIFTEDRDLLQLIIEKNHETLHTLKMNNINGWNYTLPYQLKVIHFRTFQGYEDFLDATKILENQKTLRALSLERIMVNEDLLRILLANRIMSKIEFSFCAFHKSATQFLNGNAKKKGFEVRDLTYKDTVDYDFYEAFDQNSPHLETSRFVRCYPEKPYNFPFQHICLDLNE